MTVGDRCGAWSEPGRELLVMRAWTEATGDRHQQAAQRAGAHRARVAPVSLLSLDEIASDLTVLGEHGAMPRKVDLQQARRQQQAPGPARRARARPTRQQLAPG